MTLIFLTFVAAFLLEGLGTVLSVIGLSAMFGSDPMVIGLAIALDIAKIIVVTILYKYWSHLNLLMKSYALIATIVTMTITSSGAAGYLSGAFQHAIVGAQSNTVRVEALKKEQERLLARKSQIDLQVAQIPESYTPRQRLNMMAQFKDEQKAVTDRLTLIDQELPSLQTTQINVEAKVGPILYVAKAFDMPVEATVKYVILMIISVFDLLAVYLIVMGNFLLRQRNNLQSKLEVPSKPIVEPEVIEPEFVDTEVSQEPQPVLEQTEDTGEEHIDLPLEPVQEEPILAEIEPTLTEPSQEERETITLSSLGLVKPDRHTYVGEPVGGSDVR